MDSLKSYEDFFISLFESGRLFQIAKAIILTIAVIIIVKIIVKIEKKAFEKLSEKSEKFNSLLSSLVSRIIQVIIWIIGICAILSAWNINTTPIIAGLGITGMVLGLALQESISSLFCGIMIAINKPFRIEDYIIVGSIEGTVVAMDIMCVTLKTPDFKKVTLNNKNVWSSTIVNTTFTERRRVDLSIGVEYECDTEKAKEIIKNLLLGYDEVLKDQNITVEVKEYRSSDILITARPWVSPENYWPLYWKFNAEILRALQQNGLSMAYDHVVVEMKN